MAESVSAMDSSDEEEYYDVSDSLPDPCCEEGKNTPAAPESEHVPPPGEVIVLISDQETVSLGFPPTENSAGFRLQLDYSCETHRGCLTVADSSPVKVDGLIPGTEYTFSITRIADNGNQSKATSLSVFTVDQVSSESLSLHWDPPACEVESYIVTWFSEGDSFYKTSEWKNKQANCNICQHNIKRIADNGNQSKATSLSVFTGKSEKHIFSESFGSLPEQIYEMSVKSYFQTNKGHYTYFTCTLECRQTLTEYKFSVSVKPLYVPIEPSPPVQITVDQVSSESLTLHWDTPAGEVESYIVTCCSEGDSVQETTDTNKMTFSNLKPGECFTKLRNGRISRPTVTSANTNVPPPGEVTVLDSDQETVSLGFPPTENSAGFRLQLDYSCETHSGSLTVDDSSPVKVDGLIPGTEYTFSITRIADNGNQSKATSLSVFTGKSEKQVFSESFGSLPEKKIYEMSVKCYFQTNKGQYTYFTCTLECRQTLTEYEFSVSVKPLYVPIEPSPPVQITVDQVSSESLTLHWDPPAGEVESYIVTCCSEGDIMKETTDTNRMTFNNLKPGECYFLEVSTKLRNGRISRPTVTSANTNVPPPGEVTVLDSDQETVSLGFPPTENSAGFRLQLDYSCETHSGSLTVDDSSPVKVDGLIPGTEYTFSITRIADNGNQSKATSLSVFTGKSEKQVFSESFGSLPEQIYEMSVKSYFQTHKGHYTYFTCTLECRQTLTEYEFSVSVKPLYVPIEPSPPVQITVDQVSSESLSLHWDPPAGEVESYIVICCSEGDIMKETTDTNKMTFSNLKPGERYFLEVSTKLRNGSLSRPTVTSANTTYWRIWGWITHEKKLSLSTVLSIDEKTITDEPAKCNSDLPWYFLKKLMMVNVTARNVKCTSACESNSGDHLDLDNLVKSTYSGDTLNPLDIIMLSSCALMQEMALKMSMCQFSVPLLLPNCDTKQ
ncbi:hypothetical protein F7725_004364 [Dissostichus mawsoni]|uniref:Fibronectin type-III domain-containing protein n=1 Tax=Dissostichus mawsoni TaxID=36200 RepID=A0A7J5XIU8_DISMA|nr:hypothetical protein F7725_004364 [Dissostichus mawsoni]